MSFIGSVQPYMKQGSAAPADVAVVANYPVPFPECEAEFTTDTTVEENKIPQNGSLVVDEAAVTEASQKYSLKPKKFDNILLAIYMGGPTPTTSTPPASIAVGTNFSHFGWFYVKWMRGSTGVAWRKHEGFTGQIRPTGTLSMDPSKFSQLTFDIIITATRGSLVAGP